MSATIKRYDAVHIRYEENNIRYGEGCEVEMVTLRDHLASHAYDEANELGLFKAAFGALHLSGEHDSWIGRWKFTEYHVDSLWFGWISCAKARAKAAGCE